MILERNWILLVVDRPFAQQRDLMRCSPSTSWTRYDSLSISRTFLTFYTDIRFPRHRYCAQHKLPCNYAKHMWPLRHSAHFTYDFKWPRYHIKRPTGRIWGLCRRVPGHSQGCSRCGQGYETQVLRSLEQDEEGGPFKLHQMTDG